MRADVRDAIKALAAGKIWIYVYVYMQKRMLSLKPDEVCIYLQSENGQIGAQEGICTAPLVRALGVRKRSSKWASKGYCTWKDTGPTS